MNAVTKGFFSYSTLEQLRSKGRVRDFCTILLVAPRNTCVSENVTFGSDTWVFFVEQHRSPMGISALSAFLPLFQPLVMSFLSLQGLVVLRQCCVLFLLWLGIWSVHILVEAGHSEHHTFTLTFPWKLPTLCSQAQPISAFLQSLYSEI